MFQSNIPVLGFAAYSGTGKTTLLIELIPLLNNTNLRLGVIKHTHHKVDVDHPGKDSYLLRKAGASRVLLASSKRWALMVEEESEVEPKLEDLLSRQLEKLLGYQLSRSGIGGRFSSSMFSQDRTASTGLG